MHVGGKKQGLATCLSEAARTDNGFLFLAQLPIQQRTEADVLSFQRLSWIGNGRGGEVASCSAIGHLLINTSPSPFAIDWIYALSSV